MLQHHAHDRGAIGAEGDADADLPGLLRHRVRHHAEDADDGEHQREAGEAAEKDDVEARLRNGFGHELLHRAQARHRHVRIELVDALFHRPGQRQRRHVAPQHDIHAAHSELLVWQVDFGRRLFVETEIFDVADDADDLSARVRLLVPVPSEHDALADRILVREETPGRRLAEHGHLRRFSGVGVSEHPATLQRDAKRREVVRRRHSHLH